MFIKSIGKSFELLETRKAVWTTTWLEIASVNVAKAEKIRQMGYG